MLAPSGSFGPTGRSYWVVEHRFAAGAYPGEAGRAYLDHVPEVTERLLEAGINRFVNLTQDYPGGTDHHLDHYDGDVDGFADVDRFAIRDLDVPDVDTMANVLDHIDAQIDNGYNVYVHCWGGIGRTGTVVGCWLIRHAYATKADVMDVIAELRLGDHGTGQTKVAPETAPQRAFVQAWEAAK